MKIEAKDLKIKNVFSQKTYTIPEYQRDYSWRDNEEVSLFWDDFVFFLDEKDKSFFIGPMVMRGENMNSDKFDVIDGQQRLITLAVLLSVIRDFFMELSMNGLASGLQQFLIYKNERSDEKVVIDSESPHPYFQKKILHFADTKPTKDDEKLIESARKFFYNEIKKRLDKKKIEKDKIKELEIIRDHVFEIDTVIIVSKDETDAFTIFETINTRGKNLQSLDLVKNYIVKNYPKKTGVREPSSTWKEIVRNINKERDGFFNRFWASWYKKESESKLYKRFSDYIKKEKTKFSNAEYLLSKLLFASIVYDKIITPKFDDWKINKNFQIYYSIKNIKSLFNLKVHIPFFMALIEEFENKKISIAQFKEGIQIVEHFHFIFTYIMSNRASGLDNKYSKFAVRLREDTDKNQVLLDLRKELKEKIPTFIEYKEKFQELKFTERKEGIQYVLLKLEKNVSISIQIDMENNSIDHFEPESSPLDYVQNIGNLFLLEQKYNEDKDNLKPFSSWKKSPDYQNQKVYEFIKSNTKYKSTSSYLEKITKWDKTDVDNRTKKLAEDTYNLFSKL